MISAVLFLAALLAGAAALAYWSRRGETLVDPEGVRSLATFRCSDPPLAPGEREAEERDGRGALGQGLIIALAAHLREGGLSVDAPARDDYGWALTVRASKEAVHLLLGAMEDEGQPPTWAVSVVDGAGAPGPRSVLPHVDTALRRVPGVEDLRWHKRERHLSGNLSSAAASPLDD